MISTVLEAGQQIADSRKRLRTLKLRDIAFLTAVATSEDAPVELVVHLRPHLLATRSSILGPWWEFNVSSCVSPSG